jgi:2-iminobutanoate/2-iminopropanoate deaminase
MIVIHAFANNLHLARRHPHRMLLELAFPGVTAVPPRDSSALTYLHNPPALAQPPGYSHVAEIRPGARLIFVAGQVALGPDGTLVGRNDAAAQTDQVFRNLAAALAASGASLRDVIKLNVYLKDIEMLATYRAVRDQHLPKGWPPPASTLVEVSKLFREEFLIEVEAIAAVAD